MFYRISRVTRLAMPMLKHVTKNEGSIWARAFLMVWDTRSSIATKFRLALALPIVYASSTSSSKKHHSSVRDQLVVSDQFFANSKFEDSYQTLVPFKDTDDSEVLWRLSRGLYNMAEERNMTSEEKLKVITEADAYIQRAHALDANNFAVEKWMAIILDAKTTLQGTKAKISSLPSFREHILRAIELNPQDGTSLHMMGTYYYSIADLPWYQKQIASAIFGKVPDASFEEALTYFSKAEEVQPNFYSKNLLMLGKTYQKLGMDDLARHWLKRAVECDGKTEEDKKVKKEAADILKKIIPA